MTENKDNANVVPIGAKLTDGEQPEAAKSTPDNRLPLSMIKGAEDILFNGPVTVDMNIFTINDETGDKGHIPVSLGIFSYPTQAVIQARVEAFEKKELLGFEGYRLMTKLEVWDFTTAQKTGQYFELPGDEDWTGIDSELDELIELALSVADGNFNQADVVAKAKELTGGRGN